MLEEAKHLAFVIHRVLEKKLKAAGLDLSATQALTALKCVRVVDFKLGDGAIKRAVTRPTPRAALVLRAVGVTILDPPTSPRLNEAVHHPFSNSGAHRAPLFPSSPEEIQDYSRLATKAVLMAAAWTSRAASERGEFFETKLLTYRPSPGRFREDKRQHLTVQCPCVGVSRVEAEQRRSCRQCVTGYLFGSCFS